MKYFGINLSNCKFLLYFILGIFSHCELNQKLNINGAFVAPFLGGNALTLNGSILTGEVSLQSSTTVIPLARTVVSSKAILLCNFRFGGSSQSYSSTCNLNTSGTSIEIKTGGLFSGTFVRYTVIEFTSGISVLRGEINIPGGSLGRNLEFSSAIDLKKNFLIFDTRCTSNDTNIDRVRLFKGGFTSNTKVEFKREAILPEAQIVYQIVGIDGVQVQQGETNLANGIQGSTVVINPINLSKSFLISSLKADSNTLGIEGNYMVQSKFLSNSSLEFSRKGGAGVIDLNYFIIEFLGEPVVTSGTVNISGSDSSSSLTLSSPLKDLNSTLLLFSNDIDSNSAGDMDLSYFTGAVSNVGEESKITFERARAGGSSNLTYFLIDFYKQ